MTRVRLCKSVSFFTFLLFSLIIASSYFFDGFVFSIKYTILRYFKLISHFSFTFDNWYKFFLYRRLFNNNLGVLNNCMFNKHAKKAINCITVVFFDGFVFSIKYTILRYFKLIFHFHLHLTTGISSFCTAVYLITL